MVGKEYKLIESENSILIPGRSGKIVFNEKEIGFIGEMHPRILKNWSIDMPVAVLEIDLEMLLNNVAKQ